MFFINLGNSLQLGFVMYCQRGRLQSPFFQVQTMINCNPFIVFLMSLECVKGVFYCPRQRPKFRSRKNQVQSKKTKVLVLSLQHQSKPGSTDRNCHFDTSLINPDCDISKNLKRKKAHNLLISSSIHDPFVVLFKGHHKLSLVRLFREINHYMCNQGLYNQFFSQSHYIGDFQSRYEPPSTQPVRVQEHIEKDQHGVATAIVQIYMKPQRNQLTTVTDLKPLSGVSKSQTRVFLCNSFIIEESVDFELCVVTQ